ncbi:large ribosomal subunit protein uL10c-like [Musa acuminata AAA Group]|uniref:large ribosomal subunit protein uL10c-like n=1 Tax=Musa acuminata AAA Group TaxID=214697 RepID=UPI0031D8CF00
MTIAPARVNFGLVHSMRLGLSVLFMGSTSSDNGTVSKNTLVSDAVEGTPRSAIRPCLESTNAWLFVHSEAISEALKRYRAFQRERKLEDNDSMGAVFEGRFYGPDEFRSTDTMPSRAELFGKILCALQSLAVCAARRFAPRLTQSTQRTHLDIHEFTNLTLKKY